MKKEEAEKRLMKDLKAQLDSVTDPDKFLKIANKIGYENLEPNQQQYAIQLETNRQTTEIAKGVGVGLYDAGKDFVVGTWNFVTNPGESLKGMANSIVHPVHTYEYISKSIKDSYERDMVNGDTYSRAHWVSYAIGTVATSVVGTKGAGTVTKTGVATTKTAAVKGTVKAKELPGSIANLLPYNPRNQLVMAGGVPYNAVNSAGLKEQLISMARVETEINGKGTGKKYKNYKAVEYTGATKVNREERDISRRVFQRIDIDYKRIDPESGMTNFQLMKKGRAPIWKDGTIIELHHLIQREPGSMVEIPASMHDEYNKILHGLVENGGSFRNDPVLKKQYDNFRSKYWRWRAKQIDKSDL
ncbi:HNH/ENDO VII family nuclease [Peribacillus sp. NPDC097295]|uniref:HNH/ENDO VII family nuclease n=1 Tax=Peribacillus sp. NPDC097295 TaxID=3364402 RepID=UPI00382910FD